MTIPNALLTTKLTQAIKENHRLFILVPSLMQINTILDIHAREIIGPRPTLLWLYKTLDHDSKKVFQNEAFFYSYNETEKILGNTFGALVLQDYEFITPNILARSIETIQGGGVIILVSENVLECNMELHINHEVKKRFNNRLFKSMLSSENVLVFDENFKCIQRNINLINKRTKEQKTVEILKNKKTRMSEEDIRQEIYDETINKIYEETKTDDQYSVLLELMSILNERSCKTVCSVTAARGRGKSAALGMAISLAIFKSLSTIFISAPNIENVGTIFEFIIKCITLLGYKERLHYTIFRRNNNRMRNIYKLVFMKTHRQVIEYVSPYDDMKTFPDLLIIDEAASIPIPHIKKMLGANLVFMASTISGYEGTGRSISLKLFSELRTKSKTENLFLFKELELCDPIRYAKNDPIEKWLNDLLFLNATPLPVGCCPAPDNCDLFYINKDVLFQYHKTSEVFLKNLVSLFVASHYKNSPNDLLLMADIDSHHVFTLLSPINEDSCEVPKIICAIQVGYENINNKTQREGNLIPWTIYDNYLQEDFLEKRGIRIIRIAVHPDYTRMGYGTRAIKLLCDFYLDKKERSISDDKSLILPLSKADKEIVEYIGSSFGATNELLNFWKKNQFIPIYLRQTKSLITGEHSIIMIRSSEPNILKVHFEYKRRFLKLLSSSFKYLNPTVCLTLFYTIGMIPDRTDMETDFTIGDKQRIKSFINGLSEIGVIYDLVHQFAVMFFTGQSNVQLNVLEQCVLMSLGLQFSNIADVANILNVEKQRVISILSKIVMKLFVDIRE